MLGQRRRRWPNIETTFGLTSPFCWAMTASASHDRAGKTYHPKPPVKLIPKLASDPYSDELF